MRSVLRLLKRLALLAVVLIALIAAPILYTETACQGPDTSADYSALLPPENRRAEARTFMTYPEWHIVHAYDDYAEVIRTGDPHDFDFLRSIAGYWTSLCDVTRIAASHGGVDTQTKQLVYVIGASFSVEMVFKALYEETIGRVTTWHRGTSRSPSDEISAQHATNYAAFLQQTPWYEWDFRSDATELSALTPKTFRDRERRVALGIEYGVKAAYAGVISSGVEHTGADVLTLQLIIAAPDAARLAAYPAARVIETHADGMTLETPRYRALTRLIEELALDGLDLVEIAGNDDILYTVLSAAPSHPGALASLKRQGYEDYRHLVVTKVAHLARDLRALDRDIHRLEHIHDY